MPRQSNDTVDDVASIPSDAIRCISGIVYRVLRPGAGSSRPGPEDRVLVAYKAWTERGELFETSAVNAAPHTWSVGQVMPGLSEALQLMTVGQKIRVWIPPHLTTKEYRKAKKGTLIFDVELLHFTRIKEPAPIPVEFTSPRKDD